MKNVFKNKQVGLLSGFVIVFGVGFSTGFFYYKGQFNTSFVERQSTNEALSETDDYKIKTQIKVSERTPQRIKVVKTVLDLHNNALELIDNGNIGRLLKSKERIDLNERYIRKIFLDNKDLYKLNCEGSTLVGVSMRGAILRYVNFKGARLLWPQQPKISVNKDVIRRNESKFFPLENANFSRGNFQGAVIYSVDLKGVDFTDAKMQGVLFKVPEIRRDPVTKNFYLEGYRDEQFPWLKESSLPPPRRSGRGFSDFSVEDADFSGAYLQGADLSELTDLHLAKLDGANYNSQTIFPDGFDPQKYGMEVGF